MSKKTGLTLYLDIKSAYNQRKALNLPYY